MKKMKVTALITGCALCLGVGVFGTLAWLSSKTTSVVNTFTDSDINITLTETTSNYKMVPGADISKDPKVTVLEGSEACWLFVKLDKSEDPSFDSYLTYTIADGWYQLTDNNSQKVDGVFYRQVGATSKDTEFSVLAGDKVTVKDDVTKKMMDAIDGLDPAGQVTDSEKKPTLTITAYATQSANRSVGFGAFDAWTEVSDLS